VPTSQEAAFYRRRRPHVADRNLTPSESQVVREDAWAGLRAHTDARIALGHAGVSMPTKAHLEFQRDHAMARDAVWMSLDLEAMKDALERVQGRASSGPVKALTVHSAAVDRTTYLRRPDLGRILDEDSKGRLHAVRTATPVDISLVFCDGLSSKALETNASPFLEAFLPLCSHWTLSPLVLASQARVALGDEVASLLGARVAVVLIGERPGLSSPDSMGIYLTWNPHPRVTRDDGRNCISNIRPAGMSCADGAAKLAWLLERSMRLGLSGLGLKDEQEAPPPALPSAP